MNSILHGRLGDGFGFFDQAKGGWDRMWGKKRDAGRTAQQLPRGLRLRTISSQNSLMFSLRRAPLVPRQ